MNLNELILELLPRLQYESLKDDNGYYAKVDLDTFNIMLAIVHKAIEINDEVKSRL